MKNSCKSDHAVLKLTKHKNNNYMHNNADSACEYLLNKNVNENMKLNIIEYTAIVTDSSILSGMILECHHSHIASTCNKFI